MFELRFGMAAFSVAAADVAAVAKQMPFALSRTLNTAAFATRDFLVKDTWPKHVTVRDPNFIRNALRVERSTKSNLVVAVTTEGSTAGQRAHLKLHDTGGTKVGKGRLALPDRKILGRRSSKGMPKGLRPAALPNSFRKGDVIYQRVGGKKGKRLRLMYTLKQTAPVRADVPFTSEFERTMRFEVVKAFPVEMAKALASRRR